MRCARISVALVQQGPGSPEADLSVVVDVLRATSSLVTMFGRGLDEALIAPSIDGARVMAARDKNLLLCGEQGGLPPEDFDYGNSPCVFDQMDLRGRRAVLATTNGTRALDSADAKGLVLVAAMLNVQAVAQAAVDSGAEQVVIVCAGEGGGQSVCLEDVYCAGALADRLVSMGTIELDDGARVARRLYQSFGGSAREAFHYGAHGAALVDLGFGEDVDFCARADAFSIVPRTERGVDGVLHVRAILGCQERPPPA